MNFLKWFKRKPATPKAEPAPPPVPIDPFDISTAAIQQTCVAGFVVSRLVSGAYLISADETHVEAFEANSNPVPADTYVVAYRHDDGPYFFQYGSC